MSRYSERKTDNLELPKTDFTENLGIDIDNSVLLKTELDFFTEDLMEIVMLWHRFKNVILQIQH